MHSLTIDRSRRVQRAEEVRTITKITNKFQKMVLNT